MSPAPRANIDFPAVQNGRVSRVTKEREREGGSENGKVLKSIFPPPKISKKMLLLLLVLSRLLSCKQGARLLPSFLVEEINLFEEDRPDLRTDRPTDGLFALGRELEAPRVKDQI